MLKALGEIITHNSLPDPQFMKHIYVNIRMVFVGVYGSMYIVFATNINWHRRMGPRNKKYIPVGNVGGMRTGNASPNSTKDTSNIEAFSSYDDIITWFN